MSFNSTFLNLNSRRGLKLSLLAALTMFIALGVMVADTVTKQRDASGQLEVILCKPDGKGGWKVVDKVKDSINLSVTVAQLAAASSKQIDSKHNWTARSENGRQISVRLARAGKVNLNLTSGLLELDLPFEFTIDGKRSVADAHITTGSLQTPLGSLSGKRAELRERTLSADLIGLAKLRGGNIFLPDTKRPAEVGKGSSSAPDKKEGIRNPGSVGGGSNEELVVVIKAGGRATAKE